MPSVKKGTRMMYFEALACGMTRRLPPVTMQEEEMLAFARRYADVPLHTDEDYAKTTRFGRLLAPGMLSFLAVWAAYLEEDFFGEQLVAGQSQHIEWHAPVFAGDVLCAQAEITALTPRSPRTGTAELTIRVTSPDGKPLLTGVTQAVVQRQPG